MYVTEERTACWSHLRAGRPYRVRADSHPPAGAGGRRNVWSCTKKPLQGQRWAPAAPVHKWCEGKGGEERKNWTEGRRGQTTDTLTLLIMSRKQRRASEHAPHMAVPVHPLPSAASRISRRDPQPGSQASALVYSSSRLVSFKKSNLHRYSGLWVRTGDSLLAAAGKVQHRTRVTTAALS
jgi:hypothetical protein